MDNKLIEVQISSQSMKVIAQCFGMFDIKLSKKSRFDTQESFNIILNDQKSTYHELLLFLNY